MIKEETISVELLLMLQNAQRNLDTAIGIKQFVVANIFQQYGLQQGDAVDIVTGQITYKEPQPSSPALADNFGGGNI